MSALELFLLIFLLFVLGFGLAFFIIAAFKK